MVRWPLQPFQPLQKTQLQPPFGPSVDSLCHPWVTTTNPSYGFPIFETSATALCGTTGMIWCTETSSQIKNKIKYVQHEGKTCFGLLWHFGISIFSGSFSSLASPGTVMPFYQAQSEPDIWRRKQRMNAQLSKTVFQSRLHKPRRLRLSQAGRVGSAKSKQWKQSRQSKRHSCKAFCGCKNLH